MTEEKNNLKRNEIIRNIICSVPLSSEEKETLLYCMTILVLLSNHCIESDTDLIIALATLTRLERKALN